MLVDRSSMNERCYNELGVKRNHDLSKLRVSAVDAKPFPFLSNESQPLDFQLERVELGVTGVADAPSKGEVSVSP